MVIEKIELKAELKVELNSSVFSSGVT